MSEVQAVPGPVSVVRAGVTAHITPTVSQIDDEVLGALKASFDACLASGDHQIMIDLNAVQLVNSIALEVMMDFQDQVMRLGGWIKIGNANPIVREIFRITGFSEYVTVVDPGGQSLQRVEPLFGVGEKKRLGDLLVTAGLLTPEQVNEALALQKETGKRLGRVVVEKGWVNDQDLLAVLGEQLSVPYVRLRSRLYDMSVVKLLDHDIASRLKVLPLFRVRGVLFLATANPQPCPVSMKLRNVWVVAFARF